MKEREIKIGTFRIIQNDQGLRLNELSGFEDSGRFYLLTPEATEELKKWLNQTEKKEISYQDRTYLDKRRILRQLSIKDEIRFYLDIVTDHIYDFIIQSYYTHDSYYNNILDNTHLYQSIKTLLIDGFLAFEIIYDTQKNIIDLIPIDPCTLIPKYDMDGKQMWVGVDGKVLSDNQIIYLSYYSDSDRYSTSYVEELKESYEKVKRLENEMVLAKTGTENFKHRLILKELKRADKKMKKISKIPKILDPKDVNYNSYDKFAKRIVGIFVEQLFNKLRKILLENTSVNKK